MRKREQQHGVANDNDGSLYSTYISSYGFASYVEALSPGPRTIRLRVQAGSGCAHYGVTGLGV
eukprot:9467363-Pyramimonas_sp.AAC.1